MRPEVIVVSYVDDAWDQSNCGELCMRCIRLVVIVVSYMGVVWDQ